MHRSIISVMSALNSVYVTASILLAVHNYLSGLLLIVKHMYIHKYIVYSIQLHKWLDDKCIFAYFFIDTKKQAK